MEEDILLREVCEIGLGIVVNSYHISDASMLGQTISAISNGRNSPVGDEAALLKGFVSRFFSRESNVGDFNPLFS